MLDFLRDPVWQFVGVICALVSILVSVVIYFKQHIRKNLTYSFESISLVSVNNKAKDKIQISYNLKSVSDARLVVLKIWNSGDVPILSDDYEDPITFQFGDKTEILSCDVINTEPTNIKKKVSLKIDANKVIISPLLLNKGYLVTIKLVLSNFKGVIDAETLISGVDCIQQEDDALSNLKYNKNLSFLIGQTFFIAPILIVFNSLFSLITSRDNIHTALILTIMLAIGSIFSGVIITYDLRQRGRARERMGNFM